MAQANPRPKLSEKGLLTPDNCVVALFGVANFDRQTIVNSGDRNPGDRDLETFNALFPRGNYFREIAVLGPANLFDVHPSVELRPSERVTVTADAIAFRRQSDRDGLYSPAGALLRSGRRSRASRVGEQVGVQAEWRVDDHLSLVANDTHFFAGRFIRETGPGQDIDDTTTWVQYRF